MQHQNEGLKGDTWLMEQFFPDPNESTTKESRATRRLAKASPPRSWVEMKTIWQEKNQRQAQQKANSLVVVV